MMLTDFLMPEPGLQWDYALQAGVRHAVVRAPEDPAFDECDPGIGWIWSSDISAVD